MRNSTILKWAHNNKNNKLTNGKNKDDKGNKNWMHNPETLMNGHVVYLVKFLGDIEVDEPKGIEVVKQGIQKLKFNQQLKKAEQGSKMPKAELTISVDGVTIQEPKTKKILHEYPLHRISYCVDDKAEKRFFSFIAKEGDSNRHTCFVFVSDKLAEEITLTIGQAFELAYKKFLDSRGKDMEGKKQVMVLQKRIGILESENEELKKRLKDVASIKGDGDVESYMREHHLTDLCLVEPPIAAATSSPTMPDVDKAGQDVKDASAASSSSVEPNDSELICLEADSSLSQPDFGMVLDKLDSITLDDLNDDDFDPRAVGEETPAPVPILAPPALPPREKTPTENNNNPFNSPVTSSDPFGMDSFGMPMGGDQQLSPFPVPVAATPKKPDPVFSLEELDPLRN